MKFEVGDYYSEDCYFLQDQVSSFANITGDVNRIHLDPEYASKSIFGRIIVHGFLGGSVFSKIIGTKFPGEGTIYLSQNLRFIAPIYVDTNYLATVKIVETFQEKKRYKLDTTLICVKSKKIIIDGDALVQLG